MPRGRIALPARPAKLDKVKPRAWIKTILEIIAQTKERG